MMRGIVLKDSKGNKIAISYDFVKNNYNKNGMSKGKYYAIFPEQKYEEGDWVEVASFSFWIFKLDKNNNFVKLENPELDEHDSVGLLRYFYHNISLSEQEPNWQFIEALESDEENDLDYNAEIDWIDIEHLKMKKLL